MWYFQNKSNPSISNNGNAKMQESVHKKSASPIADKEIKMKTEMGLKTKEGPMLRNNPNDSSLNDDVEKAMRDVKPEEKIPDIG